MARPRRTTPGPDAARLRRLRARLDLLAEPTRTAALLLLADGPRGPRDFGAALGLTYAATRRQVTLLGAGGLVESRKQGTARLYDLTAEGRRVVALLEQLGA